MKRGDRTPSLWLGGVETATAELPRGQGSLPFAPAPDLLADIHARAVEASRTLVCPGTHPRGIRCANTDGRHLGAHFAPSVGLWASTDDEKADRMTLVEMRGAS